MRLEDTTIATMRDRMLKASIIDLIQIKSEITEKCMGENEYIVFKDSLTRDIYAYSIINFLNIQGFSVFGGFVAAHISGKSWNDIDLISPSDSPAEFERIAKITQFLRFAFGFQPTQLSFQEISDKHYARKYMLKITDDDITHTIKIDVVFKSSSINMLWLPISIAKCLEMRNTLISLRYIYKASFLLQCWKIDDITTLLKRGEDIALKFIQFSNDEDYIEYYDKRIKATRDAGYVIKHILNANLDCCQR